MIHDTSKYKVKTELGVPTLKEKFLVETGCIRYHHLTIETMLCDERDRLIVVYNLC